MSFLYDDAKPSFDLDLDLDNFSGYKYHDGCKNCWSNIYGSIQMYEYATYKHLFLFYLHYFKIVYSENVPAVLQSQYLKYGHTRVTKTFHPNK